jgi:hypothetical protein
VESLTKIRQKRPKKREENGEEEEERKKLSLPIRQRELWRLH